MSEQGPSIDHYIDSGAGEEKLDRVRHKIASTFEHQNARDINLREREKNDIDRFIIGLADADLNRWRQELKLPEYHVPENNIHIIPTDKWESRASRGGEFVP